MTFKEAVEKLQRIANGKYHSIRYKLTTYDATHGGQIAECELYIDGLDDISKGATWELAFGKLEERLNIHSQPHAEEMPE